MIPLLIVDVQRGFINEHTAHIPKLVERLQHEYEYVFATQFYNETPSNYRRLLNWHRFSENSDDLEFAFNLKEGVQIIKKSIYTCVSPSFLFQLEELNAREVHIVGIDTDICVTKSAVDLFEVGKTPVVLGGYCASHAGNDIHLAALRILERYIGINQVKGY